MISDEPAATAFAAFGITSQGVLVAFFAARRWSPRVAERLGWITYAFAAFGFLLGGWLLATDQSWKFYVGPLLLALWAAFGAFVDLRLRVQWRMPIKWSVFLPYVALYFWAQMFLWWPLWDVNRTLWACFLVLFATNTVLNLGGHFDHERSD